jgi:hypothetical protein
MSRKKYLAAGMKGGWKGGELFGAEGAAEREDSFGGVANLSPVIYWILKGTYSTP